MVKHYIPSTLKEALEVLDKHDCYIMAGGTDLMVVKHQRSGLIPNFDKDVCYISNLEELQYIFEDEKGVHIGAGTKFSDIEENELVPEILKQIIHELASPNIRNMATMAGNIANASPAGDSIVGLYLLDAELELVNINGSRMMPIKDFIFGVRKIHREKNELIKEIFIPHHDDLNTYWRKVGSRAAESISKITFAGGYEVENGKVKDLRMAFGSVSITCVRDRKTEEKYIGMSVEELHNHVEDIIKDMGKFVTPITDQRSTKEYRYKVAMNILKDFILTIE
ncbi:MAG: FAD binding domain-containing protein [Bacilli bacterium]|nr:FAD binding domain-containing protein [Bacilli bacterium]